MGLTKPNYRDRHSTMGQDQRSTPGRDHRSMAPPLCAKNGAQNEYQLGFEMAKKWVCGDGFFWDGDGSESWASVWEREPRVIATKRRERREERGWRKETINKRLDNIFLTSWRVIVVLPLWRATVAFRKCGEPLQRLLEHHFCSLALHIPNIKPNGEPLRGARFLLF